MLGKIANEVVALVQDLRDAAGELFMWAEDAIPVLLHKRSMRLPDFNQGGVVAEAILD
jgi:hypothetical protein